MFLQSLSGETIVDRAPPNLPEEKFAPLGLAHESSDESGDDIAPLIS